MRGLLAIAVILVAAQAQAQQRGDVGIVNEREDEVEIAVFDHVCNAVLYRGALVGGAGTTVDCCTDADGRCRLTIEDQFGQREDFDGLPTTLYLRPR